MLESSLKTAFSYVFVLALIPATAFARHRQHSESVATFTLNQPTNLRYVKADILELLVEVPAGTEVSIPSDYQISYLDYRAADGSIERTSTGNANPVIIVSVPDTQHFPQNLIDQYNSTPGGLFVTASILGDMQGSEGDFRPIKAGKPGAGYLVNYKPTGQPKFSYKKELEKRFGDALNKAVNPKNQTHAERTKWARILKEMVRASNRTVTTPKSILMINRALAIAESIEFENSGVIPRNGAWTIAVEATAVRHDFPDVPCAEFMSENLREAYQRAGYAVTDDFNTSKDNELIWTKTSAVVGLAMALKTAGWVPWDGAVYKPKPGAILMNGAGESPGHAFISAGQNGRLIVDNGSPEGRDLRVTARSTIELMYQTGLFFLPPGINPLTW